MDTVSTMALEYLSMAATDYLGYDTWIEQERPVHSDSAMNIGAIMSHLVEYHRPDHPEYRNRLSKETFDQ